MKWRHYLISVCFAFLGLFAGSFIINQNKVSAIEPFYTSTVTSNNQYACPSTDSECQNRHYMTISCTGGPSSYSSAYLTLTVSSYGSFRVFPILADYVVLPFAYYTYIQVTSFPFSSCTFSFYNENPIVTTPSGSLSITENGTYDVTNYAEAVVEVPNTETIIQGDYHDDLVSINNSIMVCAGVCLVLYFFYCIYRMFIKTGGK